MRQRIFLIISLLVLGYAGIALLYALGRWLHNNGETPWVTPYGYTNSVGGGK